MATTYKKMSKKWKRLWLEALRSKKYKQGQRRLKVTEEQGYPQPELCCLGVLCDVVDPNAWDASGYFHNEIGVVPRSLRDNVKLDAEAQRRLIHMNDSEGKGFKAIANWIEKNL